MSLGPLLDQNHPAELQRRIRVLEGEVAHFQAEYQDEAGRTELIANVETLKAEVATLEQERDKWRSSERSLSAAYVKLRTLLPGALNTPHAPTAEQVWSTTEAAALRLLDERDQFKADNIDLRKSWDEMQAEVLRLTDKRNAARTLVELRTADLGSVAAERDRLKTALEQTAKGLDDSGVAEMTLQQGALRRGDSQRATMFGAAAEAFRASAAIVREAALASNPSTEEGG